MRTIAEKVLYGRSYAVDADIWDCDGNPIEDGKIIPMIPNSMLIHPGVRRIQWPDGSSIIVERNEITGFWSYGIHAQHLAQAQAILSGFKDKRISDMWATCITANLMSKLDGNVWWALPSIARRT